MQAYLRHKAHYDRRASAHPLHEGQYCYILQPKAETQFSKIPFAESRWVGIYIREVSTKQQLCCEKIVREKNANTTQNENPAFHPKK